MKDQMTVSVVSMPAKSGQKENNIRMMLDFMDEAHRQHADLVLFPELCVQGYDFYVDPAVNDTERWTAAETLGGASCCAIRERARQTGQMVVFGMAEADEKDPQRLYNSAVVVPAEGEVYAYRKIHPFGDENRAFCKGDTPVLIETPFGPVGIGICYDSYQFPELMRHYAHKGARLYLNPTAQVEEVQHPGSRRSFLNYYRTLLYAGVVVNTIFIASANLAGKDTLNTFGGGSVVIGPKVTPFSETDVCEYAGSCENAEAGIFTATIDLALAGRAIFEDNKLTGEPDYRPELYRTFE